MHFLVVGYRPLSAQAVAVCSSSSLEITRCTNEYNALKSHGTVALGVHTGITHFAQALRRGTGMMIFLFEYWDISPLPSCDWC